MPELPDLLAEAKAASGADRIDYRDSIASFGIEAIPAMRDWLSDPILGAFAVRVLERIGAEASTRRAAIAALTSAEPPTDPICRDIAAALARLGYAKTAESGTRRSGSSGEWAGYAGASPLERRFHDDMLDIFRKAGEATRKQRCDGTFVRGYWAIYFLRGVRNHGGLVYARRLLRATGTTDGFARLTEEGRLDLTMEALVLRPEYSALFTPRELQVAASRLAAAGYPPPAIP
jgi:hypothetical protein